ncbi:DUF6064 family protein [Ramlibacter sp. AN1015]|uniref:DUF6064 family protein n=1 Tax=Ramlibacter sp. AN1015 TaxID=3133428 RepID=UPI0030BCC695
MNGLLAQWWTYRPADFLMFSARSYERLLALYHQDHWPVQLPALAAGVALVWAARSPGIGVARAAAWGLALAWLWVGFGFHARYHAQINTAAPALAVASALQALVLAWMALGGWDARPRRWPRLAAALVALAVLGWPLFGLLSGRGIASLELFGMNPEPTALATLGWLFATGLRHRAWAAVVPTLSLLLGAGTLWLLYAPS